MNKMSNLQMSKFKVRVLHYVPVDGHPEIKRLVEDVYLTNDYNDAVQRFLFYVRCALELNLDLRCCNIIKGKKSIKMFQNY